MVVAEKEILSSEIGIKFSISTLQFIGPKEIPTFRKLVDFVSNLLINFDMRQIRSSVPSI